MGTYEIHRQYIPATDQRLGRHILHDSRSALYTHDTSGLTIASVEHQRTLPIPDQGEVGSCTANCAYGLLGTAPYSGDQTVGTAVTKTFGGWSESGALKFYSAEETLDGDGPYPPNDNGSTGLTMAKVARAAGCISGWTQVFNLTDFLKALTQYPIGCGTYWYNSMFDTDASGLVTVDTSSGIAGGHEYECVGYDASTGRLKFANSWGPGFGADGYFFIDAQAFGSKLLANQGDATIFTPITQPAPVPTPVPPFPAPTPGPDPLDVQLVGTLRHWLAGNHVGDNHRAQRAVEAWMAAKHLT